MNIVEMTAPTAIIQVPQVIKRGPAVDGTCSEEIVEEIPRTSASKAEARHAPQYLLLRQKTPPVTRSAPEPIRHRITPTKERSIPESLRARTRPISPIIPKTIRIIPVAILILASFQFHYILSEPLMKDTNKQSTGTHCTAIDTGKRR
jgi:hypothetical protein